MSFPRRFFLVLLALFLGAGPGWAAGSKKEQLAYAAAVTAFHDGLWALAEMDFTQFIQTYPDSTNVPEAWLLQAQAVFKQGRFIQAKTLLEAHTPATGSLTNAYTYWIGEAQFQSGYFELATNTLSAVPRDSEYALQAVVEKAAALAKLGDWAELIAFLEGDQDVLVSATRVDPDNELALRGRLLLAQAYFTRGEFPQSGLLLKSFAPGKLPPALEWQRIYLLCQVELGAGMGGEVLPLTTNLLQIARTLPDGDGGTNLSASVALHAAVLESAGQVTEAIDAFRENLSTNAPVERQQQAILKIAALSISRQQFTNAETVLENYVAQFTNAPAMAMGLLTLSELYLRDYAASPAQTNLLGLARQRLDQMLAAAPNSPFAGKAYLDRGWCGWLAGDYASSLGDFTNAVAKLPPSEDLAVARFKLGDVRFAQTNYADALVQYEAVGSQFADFTNVAQSLEGPALYQSLRAQLQLHELAAAEKTMARIAAGYPLSELSQTGALLLGETDTDLREPTRALALFREFERQNPHSALRPSVDLAIARAYAEQSDWPKAIGQYEAWVKVNTNSLLPQAMYSLAWANYQAGNETNALMLFTNFVAQFPLDALAPAAQMWVADHYFRLGDSVSAERNYKFIFQNTNWQNSATYTNPLYYPAQMMAGRAAVSRTDYSGAIQDYFQKLEGDTNCPLDLIVQAAFATGSALMKMDSPDTNNPTLNFLAAVRQFNTIYTAFPTNENGARAAGEMGDCYLQLSRYDDATNYYTLAMTSGVTNITLHSMAQVGLGQALEKKAALLSPGADQTALLTQALGDYLSVFYGNNRNEHEPLQDDFWTKKAGLYAADLVGRLGEWRQATNIYTRLEGWLPQLQDSLGRKIEEAGEHINAAAK